MEFDRYTHLDSFVHRWDARWKTVSIFVAVFACAFLSTLSLLAGFFTACVLFVCLSKIPPKAIASALKAPLIFLLVMFPVLVLTYGGTPLFSWGILTIYREGLIFGAVIGLRSLSIMLLFALLFFTTPLNTLFGAFTRLRVPEKLIALFMYTYRFIFIFMESLSKLFISARLRGYRRSWGFSHPGTALDIMVTLLAGSYEQCERTWQAMCLRGYDGRTRGFHRFRTAIADLHITFLFFSVSSIFVTVEVLL